MRLLNVQTQKLESFLGDPPPYAILSHTWGLGEITLQDLESGAQKSSPGWIKITGFLETLVRRSPAPPEYAWVDTCCIDKTSSAELSEAINAMFRWYKDAVCCYVYLDDVHHTESGPVGHSFESARWFTRGWTLQELLAPSEVEFFDAKWRYIGDKTELCERISQITKIDQTTLTRGDILGASVARKMSWAADRYTTRPEDIAYCLLGIFEVNMAMLYGEGDRAFIRLQEEIIKEYDDQSILAWDSSDVPVSVATIGALATHPSQFKDSSMIVPYSNSEEPMNVTSKGIHLELGLVEQNVSLFGWIGCYSRENDRLFVCLGMAQNFNQSNLYSRTRAKPLLIGIHTLPAEERHRVYLMKKCSTTPNVPRPATMCSVSYGPQSVTKLVDWHFHLDWHSVYLWENGANQFMTISLPFRGPVQVAVVFELTDLKERFALLLELSSDGGKSRGLIAVDSSLRGANMRVVLEQIWKGPEEKSILRLSQHNAVVSNNGLELIRGSQMYRCVISVVAEGSDPECG
ncbi:hypothetical protein G7046_g6117 [Stylonectria norvegica]|nr:hypothetical protein G7046_g6117 [Stylonectria norvegica]